MTEQSNQLREFALLGAAIRRAQLVEELKAIDKAFPDLRFQKRTAALLKATAPESASPTASAELPRRPRKARKKMTAAQKKFISERMKVYWAKRKARAKAK